MDDAETNTINMQSMTHGVSHRFDSRKRRRREKKINNEETYLNHIGVCAHIILIVSTDG